MTIWLLALVLLASLAGLGYRQGAIRVAFSLAGILAGACLAVPLAVLVKRPLMLAGIQNPVELWLGAPVLIFVLINLAFKIAALVVHYKVELYYKYKSREVRQLLWERLNHRVGLCLALVNAGAYLVLISFAAYILSYWTTQFTTSPRDPRWIRVLTTAGADLQATGFAKVARAIDRMPSSFYDMADLGGLLFHNPLLEARLSRYPAFLELAERSEFQDLGNDQGFTEMRAQSGAIMDLCQHSKMQPILNNLSLLDHIWETALLDLTDLNAFLQTGKSAKYDPEKILGRWDFDGRGTYLLVRRVRTSMVASEMQKLKQWILSTYANATMVAMTDQGIVFKNMAEGASAAGNSAVQSRMGSWKTLEEGKYLITLSAAGASETMAAQIEGDRMTVKNPGMDLVFRRED